MKRDMDYVRHLLLDIESRQKPNVDDLIPESADKAAYDKLVGHMVLLVREAGFVQVDGGDTLTLAPWRWTGLRLTWQGHEYLDNIRDPEIWKKTKEGAQKFGSFSIDIISALAKGLIQKQIENHTGVKIEL